MYEKEFDTFEKATQEMNKKSDERMKKFIDKLKAKGVSLTYHSKMDFVKSDI